MVTIVDLPTPQGRRFSRGPRTSAAGDQMAALVERMALSPDVDAAKLDRLLAYQDQGYRAKARAAFDAAYANLQLALPILPENGLIVDARGEPQHSYALWEDINEEIKPLLSEHGFSLWFRTDNDATSVTVTAVLSHLGGHAIETTLKLPVDLSGGKNAVQAIGSSTSYGKRYAASAVLNLTSRGDDDDGKSTADAPRISAEQRSVLLTAIEASGSSEAELLAFLDVASLADLPASRFARTLEAIKLRRPH